MLKFLSLSAAALLLVAGPALAAPDDLPAPAEKPAPAERGGRAPSGLMRYDTNKDGVVDRAEWKAGQEARFKRLDTNGDGKLTPDELAAAKGRMKFDDPAALDTNHDGDISVDELQAAMKARWEKWHANGSGAPETK